MGKHTTKDLLINIFSLVDQLYWSMFTVPESLKPSKIYFSENPIPDMQLDRLKALLA